MSTELMKKLFRVRQTHYNLRNPHHFAIQSIDSVYYGSESIPNLGPRIWNVVPNICPCRLCKTYVPRISFL